MGSGLVRSCSNLVRVCTVALVSNYSPRHFTSVSRVTATPPSRILISNWSPIGREGIAGLRKRNESRALNMSSQGRGGDSAGIGLVEFPLSSSSVLKILKGDITEWSVDGSADAIVNPANERMLGGGGADGAIHNAAGPQLREACYKVPEVQPGVRCPTGEARITPGFRLPAAYVIHTVGPIYDIDSNPEGSLKNSYRNSLQVAKENKVQYIAFPAISCGVFRYPIDEAAKVAISTVKEFGADLKEVHFVLFSDEIYNAWVDSANKILKN